MYEHHAIVIGHATRSHFEQCNEILAKVDVWQKGLVNIGGRMELVDSVITFRPLHQLLVTDTPKWLWKFIRDTEHILGMVWRRFMKESVWCLGIRYADPKSMWVLDSKTWSCWL